MGDRAQIPLLPCSPNLVIQVPSGLKGVPRTSSSGPHLRTLPKWPFGIFLGIKAALFWRGLACHEWYGATERPFALISLEEAGIHFEILGLRERNGLLV